MGSIAKYLVKVTDSVMSYILYSLPKKKKKKKKKKSKCFVEFIQELTC